MMIDVNAEQRRASNPLSCVWVSASAGSGKTKVLTDRVLNLLLMNGHPEKILCLTFTKTAAAEMANRIGDILKKWVVMEDGALSREIETLTGSVPDEKLLQQARKLFALTLETPGGMKIMTIHAFSQSVLKRFPLEAGVSPHFEVMDETTSADMLETLTHEALKNPALKNDIAIISSLSDEKDLNELLKSALGYRLNLLKLCRHSGLESVLINLKKHLNIYAYHSENQIISEVCDPQEWEQIKATYLTKNEEKVRDNKKKDERAYQVFDTLQNLKRFKVFTATSALLKVAFYIIELYEREKQFRSLLDYDDLIEYTRRLLEERDQAAWVLYKLDGGIDHILVDEAQDTNPNQWAIIRKLAEEFFAGEGRSDVARTIFAVGDKKQSIYSFQGADPEEFERMRDFFEQRVKQAEMDFALVPFNFSFRSTRPVLELVNHLLRYPPARVGVLPLNEEATHLAYRQFDAGLVEIWPLEQAQKEDTNEGWKPPVERSLVVSPITRLAQRIAIKIKHMLDTSEVLESAGRPVRPGDFLILVQRRNAFVTELVRILKEYNIPVAGVDRLVLTNYIAVQDLLAMAKFALLPEDDLNLAALLKSPLIRLSEDDLFKICYDRQNESVWQRVQQFFPAQAAILKDIMDKADKMPPFEFFSYILSVLNGRKYFEARLGNEVNEALDEFLNLTLSYENTGLLSLQSFLKWIRDKEVTIKRDMDQSALDAVRIMTVHGAKGLQGNIVFLPDTRFIPGRGRKIKLEWMDHFPIWVPNAQLKTVEMQQMKDEEKALQMQEYRRLLYVAVTRPKDRLYICGWDNKKKAPEGNWYDLIVSALPYQPDQDGIIRFSCTQDKKPKGYSAQFCEEDNKAVLPDWAFKNPPAEPVPSKPLTPSKPEFVTEVADHTPLDEVQDHAMRRGTFIHNLLQILPTVPESERLKTAMRLKPDDIDIPDTIFTLLKDHQFKDLFGANSVAEVPIVGVIGKQVVSGQIDRLVVKDHEVILIDYKSNRHVPNSIDKVPVVYKQQLKAYKALLKNIFPDKVIKSYLLWIQNLTTMEIE